MQSLGFCGIFKESFKLIFNRKKLFSQITLATIIPLSLFSLVHLFLSEYPFAKITRNGMELDDYQTTNAKYTDLSDISAGQRIGLFLFQIFYLVIFFILSLLSTCAVVYTIACIYTSKEVTLKKAISPYPKIWRKYLVTFVWGFLLALVYTVVGAVVLVLCILLTSRIAVLGIVILVICLILLFFGLIYLIIMIQLAYVVTLLEDIYGRKALKKGKNLMKGKKGVGFGIFLIVVLCYAAIQLAYQWLVVFYYGNETVGTRIGFAILIFILLTLLMLLSLVFKTVYYFSCKAHHQEDGEMSRLSSLLEVRFGNYVDMYSKDVQLEQIPV